jgi:hypothetical protein
MKNTDCCNNNKHKKLVLTYDVLDNEKNVSITNLTQNSTNCINKELVQKHFKLFNKDNKLKGIFNSTENRINFTNEPKNNIISSTLVFKIFYKKNIETYSVNYVNDFPVPVDNNLFQKNKSVLKLNLFCVSGNNSFSKLKWKFLSKNGIPLQRILEFS